MTKEELIDRINDIEWEDFEAKEAKSELPKNIWETVSAFANTSGGWIVLGVKQNGKKFEISGVDNAEKLEQDFLGTLRSQKFNEPVDAKSMLYHIDGHKVLAFHIASSPHKPIYYNNPQNTFIRFGSGDQRATNGEITAMFHNQSFGIKSEQILLDSNLSMLNEDTIRDYRNYFKLYSPRPNLIGNDIADFCKRIGIADNEGHLNYGGLMCFGKEEWVRRYVPTFWMDLVEIPGRSVREARTRYTYRIPEQENLWEYFQIMIRRLRLIVDTPFMMNDEGFNVEDRSQFKILRGHWSICSPTSTLSAPFTPASISTPTESSSSMQVAILCLYPNWATISILILATRLSPRYSDWLIYQRLSAMVSI